MPRTTDTKQSLSALNLQDFLGADANKRKRFVEQLGQAFSDIGFAAITGGALDSDLQERLLHEAKQFFDLPEATKGRYIVPGARGQRGFSPLGSEQAKGENTPDLKEFWQHGQTHWVEDSLSTRDFTNITVTECPTFSQTLEQGFCALEKTGVSVLEAIALYLGLDAGFFTPHITGGLSILRAIYYPPIRSEPQNAVRAAAHEDINLITLLMGASADGLEIKTQDGQWLPVNAPPGYLVINVGDMLARLTNCQLRSTTHRVVNPPPKKWGQARYSLPFFLHPRPEMSLACLPSTFHANHPKLFPDCTAGQYLDQRLQEIRQKETTGQ